MESPSGLQEDGRPEKVLPRGVYPSSNFLTRFTLVNGAFVHRHVISAALNKGPTGKRKFFFSARSKGTKNRGRLTIGLSPHDSACRPQRSRRSFNQRTHRGIGTVLSVTARTRRAGNVLFAHVAGGECFDFGTLCPDATTCAC
jgi:hypothetical protein